MESIRHAAAQLIKAIREHLMQGGELDLRLKELMRVLYQFPEEKRSMNEKEMDILEKANQILFAELSMMYSISLLSDQTGISKNILKNIYWKGFGKSFREFQHEVKMKKAAELLLSTQLSVKEICYSVGYKNVSNFSESFKKYFGYPPSKLREADHPRNENIMKRNSPIS